MVDGVLGVGVGGGVASGDGVDGCEVSGDVVVEACSHQDQAGGVLGSFFSAEPSVDQGAGGGDCAEVDAVFVVAANGSDGRCCGGVGDVDGELPQDSSIVVKRRLMMVLGC